MCVIDGRRPAGGAGGADYNVRGPVEAVLSASETGAPGGATSISYLAIGRVRRRRLILPSFSNRDSIH